MSTSQSNAIAPSILSVKDSRGEIPNGGMTNETSVTLSGKAEKGQKVEVFDGKLSHGIAVVDSTENWTFILTVLSVSLHIITAKALYGAGDVSLPRSFTVTPEK